MTPRTAGVALALAHLAIVASVALRYSVDRARLPLGWARTVPYDPSLPIRGRYVRLRLQLPLAEAPPDARSGESRPVRLRASGDRIEAVVDSSSSLLASIDRAEGAPVARLAQPVAFFIPEHVPDPSVRPAGEELWAEVTIPPTGPPRPVRLGVRRAGRLEPLDLR
jgi:hypothetical protein